jgi:ABC-type lipoprotein release transport system permease subunit
LAVWEGSIDRGGASSVERVRATLKSLSLVAQLFGLAILAVAGFGIVSGMMAEASERKRELAIKRALGHTALGAAIELCTGGIRLASIGAAIGFFGATVFGGFVAEALAPFLDALGVSGSDLGSTVFEIRTLGAPLAAVLLAGLFSLLPALRSASEPIVEGLKE